MENLFIQKMAKLYRKIEEGTASDDERMEFIFETNRCCIDQHYLMQFIKECAEKS